MPAARRKFKVDSSTGKVVEITKPEVVAACEEIEAGTNPFKRELFAEDSLPGKRTRRQIARWPIVSQAAGIDPEDIPTEQNYLAQHGVKTEYTSEGCPIFRDRAHRREHLRLAGLYDRDGGYSD